MCERERGKRREGESKRDRVHERQFGRGGEVGGMQRKELREGNYKGGI